MWLATDEEVRQHTIGLLDLAMKGVRVLKGFTRCVQPQRHCCCCCLFVLLLLLLFFFGGGVNSNVLVFTRLCEISADSGHTIISFPFLSQFFF